MSSNLVLRNLLNQVNHRHPVRHILKATWTQSKPLVRYQTSSDRAVVESTQSPIDSDGETLPFDPFTRDPQVTRAYLEELNRPLGKSYNLAAFVNKSKCLQELIKLGVSLYDIENIDFKMARKLVALDFERDCVPYIHFLVDNGLKERNLGRFISEYPRIFDVPLEDLRIRIDYLKSKKFSPQQITSALNRSSRILVHSVKSLDFKLGQLQVEFLLPAPLVRTMVAKHPEIVSLPANQYKLIYFTLIEEFGFTTGQMHAILEQQPELLDILRPVLIERLDLVHNHMGLSHQVITQFPNLIVGPRLDMKQRFDYLKKLNRNQFNPELPLYVPPSALYNGSDERFCQEYAKTSLGDYKLFLKFI